MHIVRQSKKKKEKQKGVINVKKTPFSHIYIYIYIDIYIDRYI